MSSDVNTERYLTLSPTKITSFYTEEEKAPALKQCNAKPRSRPFVPSTAPSPPASALETADTEHTRPVRARRRGDVDGHLYLLYLFLFGRGSDNRGGNGGSHGIDNRARAADGQGTCDVFLFGDAGRARKGLASTSRCGRVQCDGATYDASSTVSVR